ncbi:MAG: SPASM domain-containing protein [Bacteroidales bacterium]|nr:SPASM domain-containing protein [Bacteroidales bacterium]
MSKNLLLIFLKKINLAKIINLSKVLFSFYWSSLFNAQFRWGMPFSVSVEPTTMCNLKCPECPVGKNILNRSKGTISFYLFENIINQSSKYLLNLFLYFQGEPFLSGNIFSLIEYAHKKKIFVSTSTNGHFLTPDFAEKTVKSGLDKLIISMDGTTQSVYETYRIGGNINKVKDAIKNIVDAKIKLKSKTPFVEVQFLVFSTNEHQINEMKLFCKEQNVDQLSFKSAQIYDFEINNSLLPKNIKYRRYKNENQKWILKKKLKNRCFRLWNSIVVTWNGDVLPCCFDKDAKYSFGNVNNNNVADLISNKKFKNFAKQLQNNRKNIDICNNCSE